MVIEIREGAMRVSFRVNDDMSVELADFSAAEGSEDMPRLERGKRQFLAAHISGGSAAGQHANKHDCGSLSAAWKYISHDITQNSKGRLLRLSLSTPEGMEAEYFMQFFAGVSAVRAWATLKNAGGEPVVLEYVSSFMYEGIGKNRKSENYDHLEFFLPHNSWCSEAQWQKCDAVDLGLSHLPIQGYALPKKSSNRYSYGSINSWSTCDWLPMAIVRDGESGEVFYGEVDHSGAWNIEYGMAEDRQLYMCLLGPNEESRWWKSLAPGESFTTVPAAFGVCPGGVNEAVKALTDYRRAIRRENEDDEKCFVVFNDYMNCLYGDPTEEKEKEIIDRAAALGCEYYCLDAGWYADGFWWDSVGEWRESARRFPNGLKAVYDYARSKGLRMGMWLEIEAMGVECPLAKTLPDDWFICAHGKRRVENKRYLLDFRNPAVREYCSGVVDRLINDYGCEYFKIDYNVTTGYGSDLNADSQGDAMLEHYRCLYKWIEDIYARHPRLIIENCGSGAQRMDYGILALHSLQSTSDQTDYKSNAYIAANVASAVTPEQAGMWVYPYVDEREHVILNMVNGILLRPYISGMVWSMSDESMALLKQGIDVYKAIRGDVKKMHPFFPLGFGRVNDSRLAYGLAGEDKAYLSVFSMSGGSAEVPLGCLGRPIAGARVMYPDPGDCEYALEGDTLKVKFSVDTSARLFEISFGD